jgi:signal peptidase I
MSQIDLRGTWPRALAGLFLSILIILSIRWAILEPYVIPSGSMIPTLLIHDEILVNKFAYGIRLPFSKNWLVTWAMPQRGDVVVFRSVDDDDKYLIKRVVGLPGEKIFVHANGEIEINGGKVPVSPATEGEIQSLVGDWSENARTRLSSHVQFRIEDLFGKSHPVLRENLNPHSDQGPYEIPLNSIFMMGDNRDNSADSREWGFLPLDRVLGRATVIAVGCEETLPDAKQVCNPMSIRMARVFKRIH